MEKVKTIMTEKMLKVVLQYDETATLETLTGLLTMNSGKMTSKLHILRTKHSEAVMITISDAVTYTFDNEEELQKFLTKRFERFNTEKEMWQKFTGMDDETWEEWNKGM